ncbi:hypothetical protein GFM09_28245 [Rhizobium leguminosarum bv. viciae]|nr:hypothetical protein [Rhizobium leguminosarum bv. viciae]
MPAPILESLRRMRSANGDRSAGEEIRPPAVVLPPRPAPERHSWRWFLPKWLPDTEENDVGPFKTKAAAMAQAEALTARQLAT